MVKTKLLFDKCCKTFNLRSVSRSTALITSVIVLVICSVTRLGKLEFLELALFDLMMRSRGETELDSRITVVGITESDLQTWQQSTFSDLLLAQLLARLQQYRPAVIGLDIYRDIPQPPGTTKLLQQLEADNVIAIYNIDSDSSADPALKVPLERRGFRNFLLDPDGKIRRSLMAFGQGERPMYSLALQVSAVYLNALDRIKIEPGYLKLGSTIFPRLQPDSGGYQRSPSDSGVQTILNYRSPERAARQLSFTRVLDGDFPLDWIKGKVILIGYSAPSKKDIFSTPFNVEEMPGVMIQAQMVSQILSTVLDRRPLFKSLPQWSEDLWVLLWSATGAILVWRIKHPLTLGFSLLATLGTVFGASFLSFLGAIWLPAIPAIASLIVTAGVISAYKTFYNSRIDELTGLGNRQQAIELLEQAIGKAKIPAIAVLSLDIARFKTIEDSMGRSMSDKLLILVSKRLQNCIRSQDKLARTGVAEFSLALFSLKDRADASQIASRIQQELAQVFNLKGQEIAISTSVGIAFYRLGQNITAEELLRNSHIARQRARILGKDRYAVFSTAMYSETLAQWQLENDLLQAIDHQEFQLYYQPIIDLRNDRLVGFEALVRWISPTRGLVTPGEFISLAESTGAIVPLGNWILDEACRQMKQWHQQFDLQRELTISINLSSHQLDPDLVERVALILAENQLIAPCLKLEITESATLENVEEAIALLQQLKALGVKLSIDDFGTGYSSLSYLQQFCADTIKIDRSFICEIESNKNRAIVDIIITLAHKLDMDVIAEGIETESDRAILQSLNCEYGQGYLFAKPLQSENATQLLAQQFTTNKLSSSSSH